jgi:hypothetical protein
MLLLTASWAPLVGALLTATTVGAAPPPLGAPPQADGRQLAAELGCGGCHAGMPEPSLARSRSPRFGPGATPLSADFVFEYLADPQRRRNDIGPTRMRDFGGLLTASEIRGLVTYIRRLCSCQPPSWSRDGARR